MKHNPYRLAEKITITLLLLAAVIFVGFLITALQGWHIAGWCAAVIIALLLLPAGVEEWNARKRQWDFAHTAQQHVDDSIELEPKRTE